MAIGKPECTSF